LLPRLFYARYIKQNKIVMILYKSLREIRALFDSYVEPDFINYPPNHGWKIYDYDTKFNLTKISHKMTLYHALSYVADFDTEIPYELYEYCVSIGHAWTNTIQQIIYDSPLGSGVDIEIPKYSMPPSDSLELECISLVKNLAAFGDFDSLEEVRYSLSERVNRYQS
jgi:hypothetical protein